MAEINLDEIVLKLREKAAESSENHKQFVEGFLAGVNTLAQELVNTQEALLAQQAEARAQITAITEGPADATQE